MRLASVRSSSARLGSGLLLGAFLAFAGSSVACGSSSGEGAGEESSAAVGNSALAPASKSAEVKALDDLVLDVNGYASLEAYTNYLTTFAIDLVDAPESADCQGATHVEASLRDVVRERASGTIRKIGIVYSETSDDVFVTRHETYHYDDAGILRVVVLDIEEDHTLDDAFVEAVTTHNMAVRAEADAMPIGTEAEKVAVANKGRELRDVTTVKQQRIYFSLDGARIYETVREGLETARAIDFGDIDNRPPVLFGAEHPANVTAKPVLEHLFPHPSYGFVPLPEFEVSARKSLFATLSTSPFDAERVLRTPRLCR